MEYPASLISITKQYYDELKLRESNSTELHALAEQAAADAEVVKAKASLIRLYYQKHLEEQERLYCLAQALLENAIQKANPEISELAISIIQTVKQGSIF